MRRFKLRACPVCCEVQMPKHRDDDLYCRNSGVRADLGGHGTVRLAWFEVMEDDSLVNRLNEGDRALGGNRLYSWSGDRIRWHNWATGDAGFVEAQPATVGSA